MPWKIPGNVGFSGGGLKPLVGGPEPPPKVWAPTEAGYGAGDWPLTWLTNHCLSVLWHCWFGHTTHKIVSEMTYNVSSRTLNSTIPCFNISRWQQQYININVTLSEKSTYVVCKSTGGLVVSHPTRCRVLSLSDRRYSLNPLSQTRIDWVGRYRIRLTFKLSCVWH